MVEGINVTLASSHNHIKITTKLNNNHYSEPPENQLNKSAIIKNIKKKPHKDW